MMRCFYTVESRHPYIEQHDIGLQLGGDRDCLLTVAGLARKFVIVEVVNDLPQSISSEPFIVDDQDFHALVSSAGKRNNTEKESSWSSTSTLARLPYASSNRCRIFDIAILLPSFSLSASGATGFDILIDK